MEGVTLSMVNPTRALLLQGEKSVGQVFIDTPPGATGQDIFSPIPSFPVPSPVSGVPTARLTAFFRAGSETGKYIITFEIDGGNSIQLFVLVH